MRKIDIMMCDRNKHKVICTDFAATLDLRGAQTNNCSINNYAVVCIFYIVQTGKKKYKKLNENGEKEDDETILNDGGIFLEIPYQLVKKTIIYSMRHAYNMS